MGKIKRTHLICKKQHHKKNSNFIQYSKQLLEILVCHDNQRIFNNIENKDT